VRHASPRRPGTAYVGYAGVAEWTRTASDDNRETFLESDDGIDSPSADQLIGDSVQIIRELLTSAKGQIQNGTQHQALWNIEAIKTSLVSKVVSIAIAPARCSGFQPIDFRVGVVDEFRDGICGQNVRARLEALLYLHLQGVVTGIAVIGLGDSHVVILRIWQK